MGCSSSAPRARRPPEPPPPPPPPPRASSSENTPIADKYETIPDQTKLDPAEDVSLTSEETKPGEHLPGEQAILIPALEEKIDSVSKREEPEGTEPLPAGLEDGTGPPSAWQEEITGPSPPAPGEDNGSSPSGPAENSGLVDGNDSSVVEIIKKEHITEEDQLIEETANNEE
ncbi:glutamate-rich protein 5 isoform X2 [Dromaius novaehollandiae]|uniref:glutamate-rich protein 5 isoform X2 n=1 Tax=Dromaius novaehollandiae TaxID=8790 RepID=UPI00311EFE7B